METLIQGDCLEKLKDIDDKSVDCFICDLPYGTTAYKKSWDNKINLNELWRELKRIAKNDNPHTFFSVILDLEQNYTIQILNGLDMIW
jgi:DNA modification methylase